MQTPSTPHPIRRLVTASLLAALTFLATTFLRLPTTFGYVNLGDCFVLLSGWLLGPLYGSMAAGVGSLLADLMGYPQYAAVTFLIKGTMALIAALSVRALNRAEPGPCRRSLLPRFLGGLLAELLMVGGYFVYEIFLYGLGGAVVSLPFNSAQGFVGLLVAMLLCPVVSRIRHRI
jgi:uncharacterized membrane protein